MRRPPGGPASPMAPADSGPAGPTVQQIRKVATEASFRRGRDLYEGGRITSFKMSPDGRVTARVKDQRRLYRAYVSPGSLWDSPFCTCGDLHESACAHAVAALLYASSNPDAMIPGGAGSHADEVLGIIPRADLQKFLRSEMKKNGGFRRRLLVRFGGTGGVPRVDYREEVDAMFADLDYPESARRRLSFADFFRAAKAREREGHVQEAIRIYLEVSEAIEANYDWVDDSSGHYAESFAKAVMEMAACINRRGMKHDEKRRHIAYLHWQFLEEHPYLSEGTYRQALADICTGRADLEYLRRLHEPSLPEDLPEDHDEYYHMMDRVSLQAEVLERLGERAALEGLFGRLYRNDIDICGMYAEYLLRTDPGRVRGVLEEARGIFSSHEFGRIRHLADGDPPG